MNKKLIANIANQAKSPLVVVSADATNCYDQVAHPFASLTAQHFGIQINYILVLLKAIQNMTIHLQIAYRVSSLAYSGSNLIPFQRVVQGNEATLVLWLIISILLIRYLYALGLVSKHSTLISGIVFQLATLIYVDNTDLNILNLN